MKIRIINLVSIAAILIVGAGCNTTKFTATKPDGTKVEIENKRWIWTTENYTATLKADEAALTANKSGTDNEAIKSLATGIAEGVTKGLAPH